MKQVFTYHECIHGARDISRADMKQNQHSVITDLLIEFDVMAFIRWQYIEERLM